MLRKPSPETLRKLSQGEIIGLTADNGAHAWLGIPYAASTAGENRWRAPRLASSWEGLRRAITPAPRCVQLTNEFDEGVKPGRVLGTEDCLTLDIYAPADAAGKDLPVMVWIHGGGNVWGWSSAYDGSRLAVNEDIILVAVQYRVGPLGWFAHEALRASAEVPEDAAASFAILDLIASLKWVRDNIAVFGGNPNSVTIFGESAGGHNVVCLLASPLAKGLLHRAIVQSGVFDSITLPEAEGDEGTRANPSKEITQKLNATTADELRALPVERLLKAYTLNPGFVDVPRVIQDGVALPATPLIDAFSSKETFHAVPIIMGTNRDEMKLFYLRDNRLTKKALWIFPVARKQDFYDAFTRYVTRLWRIRAIDEPAAAMEGAGHDEVYTYRFDWDDGGRFLFMDFKKMLGAAHAFEVPFIFNRFEHLGRADRFLFQKKTQETRERLSRAMGAYWAAFARDGVPSCNDGPIWPTHKTGGGSSMQFDTDNDGGVEVMQDPDSIDRLVADIKADPRLDHVERRFIVDEMGTWMFGMRIVHQLERALDP